MPAKDLFHNAVRNALINDGWTVTDDPLTLTVGKRDLFVDFRAERVLLASKGKRKIAVEVKSFSGHSDVRSLQQAVGQFLMYLQLLRRQEPDRTLFLAVSEETYQNVFQEEVGLIMIEAYSIPVIIFDAGKEVILEWKT